MTHPACGMHMHANTLIRAAETSGRRPLDCGESLIEAEAPPEYVFLKHVFADGNMRFGPRLSG